MKKQKFPFYPLLFAVFPVLALMAYNKFETQFSVIFRPMIVALLFSAVMYGLLYFIFRKNWAKAAVVSGLTMILFFSYGHIFNLVGASPALSGVFGRHRIIVGIFAVLWVGVLILTIKQDIKNDFTKLMNIFSIILIALPLFQIGWFYLGEALAYARLDPAQPREDSIGTGLDYKPDVYYIILDTYARPDALLEDYGIDVTEFVNEMEAMGFYYADESQSNYGETFTSLSTSLNMQLVRDLVDERDLSLNSATYRDLVIHSDVRANFESLNYQTIAFSTGYRWSELSDADIYYQIKSTNPLHALTPFENLLFKTLIVYPFRGYLFEILPAVETGDSSSDYVYIGSTQSLHIETQQNVLEILPQITENKNPTFTFAHVLIPHPPFIFDADGSLLEDPGYFSGDKASAVNDYYELDGYQRQVQFINQQMITIAETILANSESAPIIIIQGDHGWKDGNRSKILNLYLFPDQDYSTLYPSITPVNSFRVIFDQYFGMDYPLVEDEVIHLDGPASD